MIKLIFLTLSFGVLVFSMPHDDNQYKHIQPVNQRVHDKEEFFLPESLFPKPLFPKPDLPKFSIEDLLGLIPKLKSLFELEEPESGFEKTLPPLTAPHRTQRDYQREEPSYEVQH